MLSSIVRLLRLVSLVICAIVIAWFAIFAYEQTKSASKHQTEEVGAGRSPVRTSSGSSEKQSARYSSVHKAIDNAAQRLTSPFAGVVSSSSEWLTRGVKVLLALLVYGFGVGFLARTVLIRV